MQKTPSAITVNCLSSQKAVPPPQRQWADFCLGQQNCRGRKGEENGHKFGHIFKNSADSNGVMIGPQLRAIFKVALHENLLTTTENLSQNKLKKFTPCSAQELTLVSQ